MVTAAGILSFIMKKALAGCPPVADGVMAEMDARVPVFPPLPEFTVPEKNKSVVSAPVESDDVPAPAPEKKEIPSTAELDAKIDALLARYGYPK